MRKVGGLIIFCFLCASAAVATPSARIDVIRGVIPKPVRSDFFSGKPGFSLKAGIRVPVEGECSESEILAVRSLRNAGFRVLSEAGQCDVKVEVQAGHDPEWYALDVSTEGITVRAGSIQALPWAAQTLAQSVVKDVAGDWALPCLHVEDRPLLAYRGVMLDPCRHPLSVEETKKILRIMARYKLNRLHWHLTDDQGWRVEIKGYPRLTQVGACRDQTPLLTDHSQGDGKPLKPFFYSQIEIKEVVDYAHSLGITVIPEIEVPGHASACIAAYPRIGNSDVEGFEPKVATTWGVLPYTLAPKPETFSFIYDVLGEILPLFPAADLVHIGGDEAPRDQWQNSPFAQRFMKEHGFTNSGQIQHYFTGRLAEYLRKHGRRIVGWDEVMIDGAVPQDTVVMAWRSWARPDVVQSAVKRGHDVILTLDSHFYFNFSQGKLPLNPAYTPHGNPDVQQDWLHVYSFDPLPAGSSLAHRQHIIGVQANCWSESIQNAAKLEYQLVPRICALAEVAWSCASTRDERDMLHRIQQEYTWFDAMQINFRHEDGSPHFPSAL